MKAVALPPGTTQATAAAPSLFVQGDRDFLAKLTLGQIIEGRILRVYEPHRGLMRFGDGSEHVVDSAVPLRQDEVIHGRVAGLGERIELRRLVPEASVSEEDARAGEAAPGEGLPALPGRAGRVIAELFREYRGALDSEGARALLSAAARSGDAQTAALAGLVLAKLGLPVTGEQLRMLQAALSRRGPGAFAPAAGALALSPVRRGETSAGDAVQEIGAALAAVLEMPEDREAARDEKGAPERATTGADDPYRTALPQSGGGGAGQDGIPGRDTPDWARHLLNTQGEGSVAHRVGTLHLWMDGQLAELDVALFEQRDGEGQGGAEAPFRHRRVALSFGAGMLGTVEAVATLVGDRVAVRLATDDTRATQFLSQHAGALSQDLEAVGLSVAELAYETRDASAPNAAVRSVVEHLVSPGRVSRFA